MTINKPRASGTWTEARYEGFIRSILRYGSRKWPPIGNVKKKARVSRGVYHCNGCKKDVPNSIGPRGNKKQNIFVDHIHPVVNPLTGFNTWDEYISRLYCEEKDLQLLCKACHDSKTNKEKELRVKHGKRKAD